MSLQGVLTLPADFARLGWGVALGLVLVIAVGTAYSGALFGKLSQLLPGSASFEDMARAALGKHGRWLVYCTVRWITSAGRGGQWVSCSEQPLLPLKRLAVQAEQ